MIFEIFHKKYPLSELPFSGKSRKSYKGYIRENLGFQPSYHFCDFLSKMTLETIC